ncbi:MAG: ASKHA domain-containing protein [Deltaproteobacteria bacterium]|nr:ASKHA domain-containing protein [Deltaproteobacteria bacterium]
MKKITINLFPFGKKIHIKSGSNLLEALRGANIPIASYCGGQGICGKCKVRILENGRTSKITEEEERLIPEKELKSGHRLSCKVSLFKDASIFVPLESLQQETIKGKETLEVKLPLFPAVKCYKLSLPLPSLDDMRSDLERVNDGLKFFHGVAVNSIDPLCMSYASKFLREKGWNVNVYVWMDKEIIGFKPKDNDEMYGLAIDIGTTTIGMYMVDLKQGEVVTSGSILNPQVKFGEDVITRLNYILKKGKKGLRELNKVLIDGLNGLIRKLTSESNVSRDEILDVVAVGNTVMHHTFLNIYPLSLGSSPFVPHLANSFYIKARELGLEVAKTAYVHTLPIEAGFVGADNVAVILSLLPHLVNGPYLIVDIGTNGEIVFGNINRLLSASCATGPAFEGANIKHGMRAHLGAIEKVKIDKKTLDVTYKVIGNMKPRGICGSGIIDAISELFTSGLVDSSGRFIENKSCERLKKNGDSYEFVLAWSNETATKKEITITQRDIRSVQLAKAAIYAGSKILINRYGDKKPETIYLAGSFGSHINIKNAYILGMFPFSGLNNIISKGNLAGIGACLALADRKKREEAEEFAKKVKYVELSATSEFQKEFLDALYIPHRCDSSEELEKILKEDIS